MPFVEISNNHVAQFANLWQASIHIPGFNVGVKYNSCFAFIQYYDSKHLKFRVEKAENDLPEFKTAV